MLRLNKRADYGILVLTLLAREPEGRRSAADIAASYQLSRHMVASILKDLSKAGIVIGGRGVNGGYTLARAPEEIQLFQIVEALEGPFALLDCCSHEAQDGGGCGTTRVLCDARPVIQKLNDDIRGLLEGISVADLLGEGRARLDLGEAVQA